MKKHVLAIMTVCVLIVPLLIVFGFYEPTILGFIVVNTVFIGLIIGVYNQIKTRDISKSERQFQVLLMLIFPPYILYVIYKH